jgi:hypothetical protein
MEDKALARDLILQVLRQRGGGHQEADAVVSGAQRLSQAVENEWSFTGARGAREQPHGSSVARRNTV